MATRNFSSAHPREGGDPGFLYFRAYHRAALASPVTETKNTWVPAFAGMSGMLGLLTPATALAHSGDHSGMSFTQGLGHMFSQSDHLGLLGLIVLVVVLGAGGAFSRRAPK